jgi:hypothetical protein
MKQTSVDWLFEQLWETPKDKLTWNTILSKAKEMEKEQIIYAYEDGMLNTEMNGTFTGEIYYNENYKSE